MAQSPLSRQICDLEENLKIQIFKRDRTGATPTPGGETLIQYARGALQVREDTVKAVRAIQQAGIRPFRLGLTPFIEHHVIATVTEAYRTLFPKGNIHPENGDTSDVLERLKGGELDAALVTLPLVPSGYHIQPIMHQPLVVCIREDDPLAQKERLTPEPLNHQLAIFSDPRHHPTAHARLLEMLTEQGMTPRVAKPTFKWGARAVDGERTLLGCAHPRR